ncbi:MAG TPA: hypothetical protein VIX86_21480 [Streptosporangiaceae bacterium]
MRLGGEPIGRWGIALLVVTGAAGLILGWQGWITRGAVAAPPLAGATTATSSAASPATSAPASPVTSPAASSAATASPAASAGTGQAGPLLSSEPYASIAYQIWPGTLAPAARLAMTGLKITVRKDGRGLLVTAGVIGQPAVPPHLYAGGARVYVVEASLGDDSGNSDYNLGDDGLVVTNSHQRVLP